MGGVVADEFEGAGVVAGDDLDARVTGDGLGEIRERPIQRDGDGLLGQGFGNGGSDIRAGSPLGIVAHGAVGERQMDHGMSPAHSCAPRR